VEDELERLLEAAEPDPDRLASAYRQAAAALAAARDDPTESWRIPRLNNLVGAAHSRLFRGPRPGVGRLGTFFTRTLPHRLSQQRSHTLVAAALFLGTAIWTWLAVLLQPEAAADLLPLEVLDRIGGRLGAGRWIESTEAGPELAASLLVHNASAAVEACALGIVAGLGTIWSLARNGAFLGAVVAVVQLEGQGLLFWCFLLPHAVLEFCAVFCAGGAGLRLGARLVVPGAQPRREAVVEAARAAAEVMVAVAALLGLAALVEAFVSSAGLPLGAGLSIALATAIGLAAVQRALRARRPA